MKAQSLGVMSYYQVISRQSREGDFSLLLLICLFGVFLLVLYVCIGFLCFGFFLLLLLFFIFSICCCILLGSFVCLCLGFFFTSSFPLAESPQWEQWDRAAACAGRAGEGLGGCIVHGKSGPKQFPPQELQALLDSQSHPRQQISVTLLCRV